jgi:hypothetical protein
MKIQKSVYNKMIRGGITSPHQCFNDTDPITLTDLKPLSDEAVIRVPGPAEKSYCFQKTSLQKWRILNPLKNPMTNYEWTESQRRIIEDELGMYWSIDVQIKHSINESYLVDEASLRTDPPHFAYIHGSTWAQQKQLMKRFEDLMIRELQTLLLKPFERNMRILSVERWPGGMIGLVAFVKNSNRYRTQEWYEQLGFLVARAYANSILPDHRKLQNLPDDFFTAVKGTVTSIAITTNDPREYD